MPPPHPQLPADSPQTLHPPCFITPQPGPQLLLQPLVAQLPLR
jgi:hypothetical protein